MPVKILALHHVLPKPRLPVGPQIDICTSPDALRECLEAHRDWKKLDYRRALDNGRQRDRALVITFDDGYVDTLTEALPLLEAYDVPCILFVVSGYLDRTVRPMESDMAWMASQLPEPQRASFYRQARWLRRRAPEAQRQTMVRLAQRHQLPYPPPTDDVLLSWEQLGDLARHPLVTIGSHTVSHALFGRFDAHRASAEAAQSKARLEEVLREPVECFAFPYGRHSAIVRRSIARAGYRFAFTSRPRLIERPADLNRMAVPRFAVDGPAGWGPLCHHGQAAASEDH
ncbi:MAG: polysaccharide deacetylase family protein [Planctomycetota bacterium]|jgi:peptidoglycan/xylan/chitin deacetylase (PgdA/CDA1 family)